MEETNRSQAAQPMGEQLASVARCLLPWILVESNPGPLIGQEVLNVF